jgi:pyruvate/2-oxoglutarate/acetoin dehydrogenase E1 component
MAELRYVHALNKALEDQLSNDDSVFLLGEDIANAGGSFKATRGLLEKFGSDRVRDTPISEAALSGLVVGAALTGLKPVLEIMFMDFVTLAMDGIVNQAAKSRFMFGGQASVPLVVRMPHGGGMNAGPQHSQCLEAWFSHVPGLKVVCPATVQDAYALTSAAIRDPDPVILVENKALYAMKGELPDDIRDATIGEALILREGQDVTLVSYGAAVFTCLKAAEAMANEGISVEVIDLRTLQPWDKATVSASLEKTHRAIVVHEAVRSYGAGAEIAATIGEICFDELDAPVGRVGAPFMPVPYAPSLEKAYIPDSQDVIQAIYSALE